MFAFEVADSVPKAGEPSSRPATSLREAKSQDPPQPWMSSGANDLTRSSSAFICARNGSS